MSAEAITQPFPENLLSCLTKHPTGDVSARGDFAQDLDRKIANLLGEAKNFESVQGCGVRQNSSNRTLFLVQPWTCSVRQRQFMPRLHPSSRRGRKLPNRIGLHTRHGRALAVKVSAVHDVYGVEIQMYVQRGDGSKSLELFSRCANIDVTELSFGSSDSIYFYADTFSTRRPCAPIDKERPASPNMTTSVTLKENATHIFVHERKWERIPNVDSVGIIVFRSP